jgi:uncharacterized protein (TIGR02145 family)
MKTKNIKMYSRRAVRLCGHYYCLLVLLLAFAGCKKDEDKSADIPPLAASTQTWTFGDQIWSDAIQCPECDKETLEDSYTEPQCRSYADLESGKTFYYYNWPHVNQNATNMCPSPWRVPTKDDFEALVAQLGGNTEAAAGKLRHAWGYGGYAYSSSVDLVSSDAYIWTTTKGGVYDAYSLGYYWVCPGVNYNTRRYGFQVRCVK